jgi:hypothetical protein
MDINPIVFPTVTNRESWSQLIGLYDDDTGDPLDLSQFTSMEAEIRRRGPRVDDQSGYTPLYDYGGFNDYGPAVQLSLGNGLTVIDIGQLLVSVTSDQMRSLSPEVYSFGLIMSNGTDTRQFFLGTLPVLFGGVT